VSPTLIAAPALPAEVVDAACVSIENTLASILGSRPVRTSGPPTTDGPALLGIISFVGDEKWSLSLMLVDPVASTMVERFCGMALPFDSPDLGDAVGELVNVIAGEVVAQMEKRRLQARMSLPIVIRGQAMALVQERGTSVEQVDYSSACGPFCVRLTTVSGVAGQRFHR
jgi:CheY-specific phosphatase CheX